MLPIAWYLLKVMICSGILFGYYWLLLRNKIFHQYNRFYLLAAVVLSLALPLIQINFWQQHEQHSPVVKVLQAVASGDEYINNVIISTKQRHWDLQQLYPFIYLLISTVLIALFLRTLFAIRTLLKKYPAQILDKVTFIKTDDKSTPFSFLNFIFWNNAIDPETTTGQQIFKHEVAHVQEKHTYDKLFVNIVLLFGWSNPFFWLIRRELNMIHEFIADKKAIEDSDTAAFAAMILQATYPQHRFQLTNNFFYSPIKRRLLMLTKNKNPRVNYLARIMVLPLAVLVFAAFTLKTRSHNSFYNGKKITVVIDAGHGGIDAGAKNPDGTVNEKDLNLAIAKKIKELNTNDKISIVLTREDDSYISVADKSIFTNNLNADLLISIHIDNGPAASVNKRTGMSVWIAKDEYPNTGKSKILASAIINTFNGNYGLPVLTDTYQRQAGIWLLQESKCPAVLLEAGFINNEKDLAYLQTGKAKETIAQNVLAAIEKYLAQSPVENKITDTVPPKLPAENQWKTASGKIETDRSPATGADGKADPEKALVIMNGKIVGKGREATELQFSQLYAKTVNIKWLTKAQAIAKYGKQGTDGACEMTYTEGTIISIPGATADKMNILYIGMDNPMNIVAQNVSPDDLLVNISDGSSISGSNGKYIARVMQVGDVTLTLSKRDGTKIPGVFIFKAMHLPDPNADLKTPATPAVRTTETPRIYVGEITRSRADISLFKKQKEIYASAGYKFSEANVYFSGVGFTNVAVAHLNGSSLKPIENLMEQCVAGTVVTFDNVRVTDARGGYMQIEDLSIALTDNEIKNTDDRVFNKVEVESSFPGGDKAWRDYLIKNINATIPVDEGWKAGVYTVIIQFIVHTDGSISDVTTTNYKGSKTAQHCIDMIKKVPKWIPATQNGRQVAAYRKQPITFVVEEVK